MSFVTVEDEREFLTHKNSGLMAFLASKNVSTSIMEGPTMGKNTLDTDRLPSNLKIFLENFNFKAEYSIGNKCEIHAKSVLIRRNSGYTLEDKHPKNTGHDSENTAIGTYSKIYAKDTIYVGTPKTVGEEPRRPDYLDPGKRRHDVGNFCLLKAVHIFLDGDLGLGSEAYAEEILIKADVGERPVFDAEQHEIPNAVKRRKTLVKAKDKAVFRGEIYDDVVIEVDKGGFVMPQKNANIHDKAIIKIGDTEMNGKALKALEIFESGKKICEEDLGITIEKGGNLTAEQSAFITDDMIIRIGDTVIKGKGLRFLGLLDSGKNITEHDISGTGRWVHRTSYHEPSSESHSKY